MGLNAVALDDEYVPAAVAGAVEAVKPAALRGVEPLPEAAE